MRAVLKKILLLIVLLAAFAPEAFVQVKAGTLVRPKSVVIEDSIIYEAVPVEAIQHSLLKEMNGTWELVSQKRQPALPPETLQKFTLNIRLDSIFAGSTPCYSFSGKLVLRGAGIRFPFHKVVKEGCKEEESEIYFFKLLHDSVATYSVAGNSLQLRNSTGLIVFEAIRKME